MESFQLECVVDPIGVIVTFPPVIDLQLIVQYVDTLFPQLPQWWILRRSEIFIPPQTEEVGSGPQIGIMEILVRAIGLESSVILVSLFWALT